MYPSVVINILPTSFHVFFLTLFLCCLAYFKPHHQSHVILPVTTSVCIFGKDILKNNYHAIIKSNKINNNSLNYIMLGSYSTFCDCLASFLEFI